jgi:hypothetical protein
MHGAYLLPVIMSLVVLAALLACARLAVNWFSNR